MGIAVKVPTEIRNWAKYLTAGGWTCFRWIDQPTMERQIAGRRNGQRLLILPLMRDVDKPAQIPAIQTGMVMTCALLAVQPSWLRIVGLNEEIDPADISAQKKRSVMSQIL
jgi:hypothetical protein